jgi:hypothetical protein
MSLENLNLVELEALEVNSINGGGWINGIKYAYQLLRDAAVTEAIVYGVNNALTPSQAADYYRYRGM